jgi:hypothetical protein
MLSSYSAMPREGHFKAMMHVIGYLKAHSNSPLIFDPKKPDVSNLASKNTTNRTGAPSMMELRS